MKHIATLLALALACAFARADADSAAAAANAEYVRRVLARFNVPGIAIAVVKDGHVLEARGFGVRKLGEPAAVDSQTLFDIAANSKGFTAAMLAMLVDEGKLAWDDPVIGHLPQFQMHDPWVTRAMTLRDLLANHSGLGDGAGDLLWWPSSTFSTDEIIARMHHLVPVTSFRSSYQYEYLPYIVAGKIIALKTGMPWGAAVRQRIFTPLAMTHSTASAAESEAIMNRAAPHSRVDGKLVAIAPEPMANAAGAMGISSSAEDMARWMTVLLAGGEFEPSVGGAPRRLFSAAQSHELWTPQTPIRVLEPKPQLAATRANFAAYGLGFEMRDYQGLKLVWHRGWQFGQYSTVVLVPSKKLGIAIVSNAESAPALNTLKYRLLDRYLDLPSADWIALFSPPADQAQGDNKPAPGGHGAPSLPLSAYDGLYRDAWYGDATIRADGGTHVLSLTRSPGLTGTLEHVGGDTFMVRWRARHFNADAYVTFALRPDGSIARMKLAPVSADTDSSFDFVDLEFVPVQPGAR